MEPVSVSELTEQARLMSMPIFLAFVGLVVLLSDLVFNREDERRWPAYLTVAGLVGALFLWVQSWLLYHPASGDNLFFGAVRGFLNRFLNAGLTGDQTPTTLFGGMYDPVGFSDIPPLLPSNMTLVASLLVAVVALIVALMAPAHLERRNLQRGEFYALILFATVGSIVLAGSAHLIMIFIGIELLSIPLYILAGFARPNLRSEESALKYFLLGAFSSAFLLYGIALIYGATGTMDLNTIRQVLGSPGVLQVESGAPNLMVIAGLTLLLVGIGFKISVVPFHQWTPDVYEGAPTPVTAFMVAGTKVGGFAALINILVAFIALYQWWSVLIVIFAVLTMVVGNVGALVQTNIKRMLAYSSIAHAGYMLVGVAGFGQAAGLVLPSLLLYLAVYALMNLGAFAVLIALEEATGREVLTVDEFRGLGRDHPGLGLLLGFFLLSLAGFPPTAGFFAKFFLFTGAVVGNLIWLVVAATVLSVLSIFYYARFIVAMFMQPRADETPESPQLRPSWMVGTAMVVTALLILGIGLFPNPLLGLFQ